MPETQSDTGDIGVLVVHGIGAQDRDETLSKLMAGLRRVAPDAVPEEIHDGVRATIGGQGVRFYEVYWADLLRDEMALGAFQMMELQSLAWFPWLNFRRGHYGRGSYSSLKLAAWCFVLPIINFFVLFAYYGAGLVGEVFSGFTQNRNRSGESDIPKIAAPLKFGRHRRTHTRLDSILDEYLGDVFSYVNSAGKAFHREQNEPAVPPEVERVYTAIMQRFYEQLMKAADDCATLQIVAHSLGTVVTYHGLSGLRLQSDGCHDAKRVEAARAKVRHLYTIGSPLEKIRFVWPRLGSDEPSLPPMQLQWDNFVSWFDPVAGKLRRFECWGKVCNHHLLGGGFISGHVVYERSALFLRTLTRGLCGHEIPLDITPGERRRDLLVLIGETLLAPTLLLVVLVLGAAVFALTIALLPFLISLPLRVFLPPETWAPIVDTATLVLGAMMIFTLLLVPLLRAVKVHALFWAAPAAERPARH